MQIAINYAKASLPTRERGLKLSVTYRGFLERQVAPHAGAWIETTVAREFVIALPSLPTRERGLKQGAYTTPNGVVSVAPHAGAWIETLTTSPI